MLQVQIGVSTILMTAALWPIILGFLPASYNINFGNTFVHGNAVKTFFCISVGLWGGCVIGFVTEYFTSFSYNPTQEVARSTETGAATNIIYGLALGYKVRQLQGGCCWFCLGGGQLATVCSWSRDLCACVCSPRSFP